MLQKYPHIDLRPKTKTKHPFSIDDPLFNYDFLFKKDDESNESKLEKESTKEIRFKNNFDDTPEGEVYDHFYAGFIYEKGRDRQKDYLSESDLDKFLKAAFEDKKPLKKLFTLRITKRKLKFISHFIHTLKLLLSKEKERKPKRKKERMLLSTLLYLKITFAIGLQYKLILIGILRTTNSTNSTNSTRMINTFYESD